MLHALLAALGLAEPAATATETTETTERIDAVIRTSMGSFEIMLYPADAPQTVAAWKANVPYFDGTDGDGATIFHRVIAGFMVQGGGHRVDGSRKPTRPPIQNEANNGHKNRRGTLAMARRGDPDSASTQWFVNVADNSSLDFSALSAGYTVFGRVVSGMHVVDAIAAVPTQPGDVPFEPIVIEAVELRG